MPRKLQNANCPGHLLYLTKDLINHMYSLHIISCGSHIATSLQTNLIQQNRNKLQQHQTRLEISVLGSKKWYHLCSENKGADQLRGCAQLIYTFVFSFLKSRYSCDAIQLILLLLLLLIIIIIIIMHFTLVFSAN